MLDGLLNTILLYIGIYKPTILTQGYSLLGLIMWTTYFRRTLISTLIYKLVIIYSILVLAAKLLLLTMYWINSSIFSNRELFTFIGIFLEKSFNYNMFMNFYPEVVGIIVSISGILYRKRLNKSSQSLIRRSILGIIVIINLLLTSLSIYTIVNTLYFLMLITWISMWGYRVNERFLVHGIGTISLLALIQIIFSGIFNLLLKNSISENSAIKFGILQLRNDTIFSYISTLSLFFTSVTLVRRLIVKNIYSVYPQSPLDREPLVRAGTQGDELPTFFTRIMEYLTFTLIYGICVFNVFLWIANFNGYVHFLMLFWLFYSIIEKTMKKLMDITRKVFIPILLVDCVFFYVYNLIELRTNFFIGDYKKEYSMLYLLCEVWTISMFLLLQRRIMKKKYDHHANSISTNIVIGVFLENSNKISLIVVFLIGLSRINVFHLGFMMIFLVFILSSDISKKYWIFLVYYTQFMLLISYTMVILKESGTPLVSDKILEIIGFECRGIELVAGIFPKDYLVWMLLLSAAMQLSAYRSSYVRDRSEVIQTGTRSKVIILFSKINQWLVFLFIWIVYIALFLAINMSALNLLNLGRYLIFLVLFVMHVINTSQLLNENFAKVDRYWNFIIYYSGLVLVVRYLFQFLTFVPGLRVGSDFIGIKIYDDGALYESMATDCVILLMVEYQKTKTRSNRLGNMGSVDFLDNFSVTAMIKKKTILPSITFNMVKEKGAKYFVYLYILIIIITAIFWRLSISMIIYLLTISIFIISIENYMHTNIKNQQDKSMSTMTEFRIALYKSLMIETLIYMVLSYCCFFIKKSYLTDHYDNSIWAYFVLGFSLSKSTFLLSENYVYLIILILLTCERLFLDGIQGKFAPDPTPKSQKANLSVKIIVESFTPSLILAIGFYKLTVVTIFNSLSVIVSIRMVPVKRLRFLFYCLFIISVLQYLSLLVNLSYYDSPYETPDKAPEPLWKYAFNDKNSEQLSFLNLGNNINQTFGLIGDFLLFAALGIYYAVFALGPSEFSAVIKRSSSSIIKKQTSYKEIFYSSVHFFILFIVLIFISESSGLFSLCYCIFCLIAIFMATKILKCKSTFYNYLKLLKNFLIPLMCFELLAQSVFQLPVHDYLSSTTEEWLSIVGLTQLWPGGGSVPDDLSNKWKRIYFKIFTLGFILLAYWLMTTKDFGLFIDKLSAKYRVTAKKIGLEMAQAFNNSRLKQLKRHEEASAHTEKELEKLEENVQKWNEKFYSSRYIEFGINKKRGDKPVEEYSLGDLKNKYKPGMKRLFQNMVIKFINPVIFKHFLCRLKLKKNLAIDNEEEKKKDEERRRTMKEIEKFKVEEEGKKEIEGKEKEKERKMTFSDEGDNLEVVIEKLKRKQHPYIINYKDWLKIFLFVICSSTQGIVFLCFFMNHFYYASLESLVFPMSVLCYGILTYPRPSPNYFRIMLIYTEAVFLIKFIINLYVWKFFSTKYSDTAKLGFNFAKNTYSQDLTPYVVLDALCILTILAHEYFLIRCGLNDHTENELESLIQARTRKLTDLDARGFRKSLLFCTERRVKANFGDQVKDFFYKIGGGSNVDKPGCDYYTRTVLVQLLILLFLLFFFSQMAGEISNFSNVFVANSFPGSLVVALIFQGGIMFIERYLYLDFTSKCEDIKENQAFPESEYDEKGDLKSSKSSTSNEESIEKQDNSGRNLKMKFWFHLVLVITVHVLVFWYFPINGNMIKNGKADCEKMYNSFKCNNFQINSSLKAFYFLYFMYFVISAYQIKYGAPKSRAGEFVLTKSYNSLSNIVFLIYRGMPFLYEIRTLVDWTFTPTALNLMQWFKFEEIYANLYNTKCDQLEFAEHPRGHKRKKSEKFFKGCCFLFGIILCILAPLIIFSSLNPIVFSNPLKEISLSVGIETGNSNFYDLSTVSIITTKESVSTSQWNDENFNEVNELSASDRSLMEKIVLSPYSDNYWEASNNSVSSLCNILNTKSSGVFLQAKYKFTREYPNSQQVVYSKDSAQLSYVEIGQLYNVFCNYSNPALSFNKISAFSRVIRLVSTGTSILPVIITGNDNLKTGIDLRYHDLSYSKFWEIRSSATHNISLYVISEKYSPVTFNFSVITFYISVVYLIGKILRMIISGGANNIPLVDMPNPDPFINVCTGIYVSRMNGCLDTEETLYYELIDMLRSPELMKMISGSSSIKKKND